MIHLAYCNALGPDHMTAIVVAAGDVEGAAHYHESDGADHPCVLVVDVAEEIPASYPWTTGDGTIVANADEWLSYLGRYVP